MTEADDFTSEHRTFAEREGYKVAHANGSWFIIMPRRPRPGEKTQTFKTLEMAWEVAAIRAGRKIAGVQAKTGRPSAVMQAKRGRTMK